jgi:hypothetical protein
MFVRLNIFLLNLATCTRLLNHGLNYCTPPFMAVSCGHCHLDSLFYSSSDKQLKLLTYIQGIGLLYFDNGQKANIGYLNVKHS